MAGWVAPPSKGIHAKPVGVLNVGGGDLIWFGPLKRFQKLFFHTPLVNLFVMGSEAYHDYYRWPLRDKRVFDSWKAQTEWGQLFSRYQAQGSLAQPAARVG